MGNICITEWAGGLQAKLDKIQHGRRPSCCPWTPPSPPLSSLAPHRPRTPSPPPLSSSRTANSAAVARAAWCWRALDLSPLLSLGDATAGHRRGSGGHHGEATGHRSWWVWMKRVLSAYTLPIPKFRWVIPYPTQIQRGYGLVMGAGYPTATGNQTFMKTHVNHGKKSSKFVKKFTHIDDMMIHKLVKYLVQTRLRLWAIKITNSEICYFYSSQTKSSLDNIF